MADNLPAKSDGQPPAVRAPENPMEILAAGVQQGIDPAGLATLSELAEKWLDRDARKAFFGALKEFRLRCPSIVKDQVATVTTKGGAAYSYAYASLPEIARIIDPILDELGLTYRWSSETTGTMMTVRCHLSHVDGHEEISTFTCPTDSPSPRMSGQQKAAGAQTFARRYSLTAVLGLTATDDDDDGRGSSSDVDVITAQEAADLEAFADEVSADKPKFLKWLGAASFETIPKDAHEKALKALAKKRDS